MRHVDGPGAQQFSYHYMVDGAEYDFRHFYTSNVSLRRDLLDREPEGFSTEFPAAAFEDAELAYRLSRPIQQLARVGASPDSDGASDGWPEHRAVIVETLKETIAELRSD